MANRNNSVSPVEREVRFYLEQITTANRMRARDFKRYLVAIVLIKSYVIFKAHFKSPLLISVLTARLKLPSWFSSAYFWTCSPSNLKSISFFIVTSFSECDITIIYRLYIVKLYIVY